MLILPFRFYRFSHEKHRPVVPTCINVSTKLIFVAAFLRLPYQIFLNNMSHASFPLKFISKHLTKIHFGLSLVLKIVLLAKQKIVQQLDSFSIKTSVLDCNF